MKRIWKLPFYMVGFALLLPLWLAILVVSPVFLITNAMDPRRADGSVRSNIDDAHLALVMGVCVAYLAAVGLVPYILVRIFLG